MDKNQVPLPEKIGFTNRIQTRLIVGLLLLAVLPLAFLGPYAYRQAHDGYEEQIGQNIQGVAYLVKSQIADALETGDQQVSTWTKQSDARIAPTVVGDGNNIFALLQNRFRNFLKSQREVVPIFSEILCVKPGANDASGNASAALVLYSTDQSHERKAIFDGFWEKQDGKFQVSPRFLWQTEHGATRPLPSPFDAKSHVIPIVRSYQDTNGETVALIGLVNINEVQRLIANTAIGDTLLSELVKKKDTYALLTEKDGTIITGLFPEAMASQNSIAYLLKNLLGAKQGRAQINGVGSAFLGRSDFGHGGWQVVSVRNSELAMAPIDSLRKTMVAAIVLLLGVIVIFSIKIAKRITDPVQDLVQATYVAAEGDLSRTIEVKTKDEIGVLARCFNHMTLQLKNSFKVLEQQNEELKRLDRLKSEFLANTSHELRTPMNGIIGLLDATLSGAFGNINETVTARLKLALTSANRLKMLVNDMLDFSANQSSGEDALLSIEEVDLAALIRDQIVPQFEGMNLTKKLEFKFELEKDMPKIHADPEKLRQVFTNLFGNAFKFTAKGSITVRTKTLKNEQGESAYIQCEIQDTGIGIPTHLLAKIFDVFYQVDGGADRKYEGTGLGLAIAKQIVEQHGGEIWAESVLGQGATFFIKQPIRAEADHKAQTHSIVQTGIDEPMSSTEHATPLGATNNEPTSLTPEARRGEGEVILVVDDEPVNVEVLRAQLEFHNYKVVGMNSGHAAIDYLKACNTLPALVLLDIMMPEMSGYDFCRHLKDMPALKNIPIVMVSAKNQMVDRIYGLNLGALDYIVKPFEKAELLAKIRVYLDLQKLHRDLEKLNADLENKVKERTMELEVAKAKAESLAMHDTLTGLPNRNLFQDRLSNTFARSRRAENQYFAVAFVDLDNFKVINDSLGHEVGDKLLMAFGERVRGCLREVDTVARFGGDEFTLILAGMENASDASHIINRIHESLKEPFIIEDRTIHATASIGVALNNPGYNSPEDLLRDADTAMYQAKARGKSRHEIFSKDMHFIATERFKLEAELRSAIKFSEFCLYYQPIISFETGAILGFEALVRWNHRERGIIGPNDFLNLAEETGLIVPIGRWVVGEACQQVRIWEDLGLKSSPTVSVNISAKQFKDSSLVEDILGAVKAHKIAGEKLKLEITESALIVDLKKTTDLLLRISDQKLGLLLDDFGTGYSSLSYLYRLPFQGLKIDRSFVESMLVDEKQANIIRATVAIGKSLGLTVTAEGVETVEQIAFLREAGCHYAQGYYFAKPMPAEDATKLLINEPSWMRNWDQLITLKSSSGVSLKKTGTEI